MCSRRSRSRNCRRWLPLSLVASLCAGCAYHGPTEPSYTPSTPSTTPASIRLVAASRVDRRVDIVATVLTADGHFVSNVPVTFTTTAGTLTVGAALSDSQGDARTIVTAVGSPKVSAATGGLVTTLTVQTGLTSP